MKKISEKLGKRIWASLVKRWTPAKGVDKEIAVNGVLCRAMIPTHNRYDLMIVSASKANHPRTRGRFYFGRI